MAIARACPPCWLLAAGFLHLAGCSEDARSGAFRSSVLVVAPDDPDPLDERLTQSMARYLGTITALPIVPVTVPDAEYDSLADVEALAARHRAGLVVVLASDRLASDRVDDA